MTKNQEINIIKIIIVVVYSLFALFFIGHFPAGSIFFAISHFLLINVIIGFWMVLVYVFATNYIERRIIEYKLDRAQKSLGQISESTLISYKRHDTHVTMKFRGCGVCVDDWEKKRAQVQSAINYRIIDISHDADDFGIIIVNAIKGCRQNNSGVLYDDGL